MCRVRWIKPSIPRLSDFSQWNGLVSFPAACVQSPLRFNRNKNKRQWNLSTQKYRSAFQSSSAWTWSNARCARRIQCNLRKIWTHPMIQKLGIDWTRSDSRSIERIKCFPFRVILPRIFEKTFRNIVVLSSSSRRWRLLSTRSIRSA